MNIKPNAEGNFYPKTSKALLNMFNSYLAGSKSADSRLIIVPHAGYEFSGEIALKTYRNFPKNLEEIIIIAPAIYNKIYGIVSSDAQTISTPIGKTKLKSYDCEINNKICQTEPSFCVQIPFIKYLYPNIKVIPIIYGCTDYNNLAKIISEQYSNGTGIVIVSNLSRFLPARQALKLDNQLSIMIERLQTQDLDIELADGAIGICAAIKFAKENNLKLVSTGHSISSDVNEDTSSVVGYGGWYLTTQ